MTQQQGFQLAYLISGYNQLPQLKYNTWNIHQWIDENITCKKGSHPSDIKKVGTWAYFAHKFQHFLDTANPAFTLFTSGNKKLSFKSWSTLPIITCPSAGKCKDYCYSLKAWRYPAAYFRQCQNLWLLNHAPFIIEKEWMNLPEDIVLRLYVDGDFHNMETLAFWFRLLEARPDIQAYGYSKSWPLFLKWEGSFPPNYKLNLSNDSIHNEHTRQLMLNLPCTRGDFIAVSIDKEATKAGYGTSLYRKAVQKAAGKKVFVCPALCDHCTPRGHACGLDNFKGVPIAIGIH